MGLITLPTLLLAAFTLIVARMVYNMIRLRNMPPMVPFYALSFGEWLADPIIGHAGIFTNAKVLDELAVKYGGKDKKISLWVMNRPCLYDGTGQVVLEMLGRPGAKHPDLGRRALVNHVQTSITDLICQRETFFGGFEEPHYKRSRKFLHRCVMQATTTSHMMDILQEEVVASLRNISLRAREKRAFMPHNVIKTMPLNFMMRMYTSSRYEGEIFDDVASYNKAIRDTIESKTNNRSNMTGALLIYVAEEIMRLTFSPSLGAFYPSLWKVDPLCRDADKLHAMIDEVVSVIIAEHRKWSEANPNAEPRDIVDSMLVEVDKGNLVELDIRGQIVDALAAGTDTVSSWLEQYVHHMADHPEALAKVQEEIDHAVGDRLVQPSDLPNLPYFWATLKEVERHASLSTFGVRETIMDVTYDGYEVPARGLMAGSMDCFRFSPEHVKDPAHFNPENFLDDPFLDLTGRKAGVTFAFGGGLRVCVGARLAEKELLLYGANLAHCFTWRSPTGEKICKSKMSGLVRHCVSAPVLFTQRRHFEELDK